MQGIKPPMFAQQSEQLKQQSRANLRNNDISASLLLQSTSQRNIQPSQLEYKIQKLLHDSSRRQEKYINFIKEQKQKSYEMTELYLSNLKRYKQQLDNYIQNRKGKQVEKFQKYKTKSASMNITQVPVNKYKKVMIQSQQNISKQSPYQIHLKCAINFIYYTPLVQDYVCQTFPQQLQFIVQTQYPYKRNSVIGKVLLQQDLSDNLDNLINEYPFQLITIEGGKKRVKIQFSINNSVKAINFYKKNQFKIKIQNKLSQMIYGEGIFLIILATLQAQQFLYYSSDSTSANPQRQSWNEKIQFYCPFSHKLVAYVHAELQNIPTYLPSAISSRIQSTQPLQLTSLKVDNTLYGDKQSRMIQRINKYKTATNSLLMSNDLNISNNAADKEMLFQNSNDKTLVMHRHKKQLQFVNKYKQEHRGQYMEKVMHEALDKFCLDDLQMGVPKYLPFYYKTTKNPQKIAIIPSFTLSQQISNMQSQINISIVPPKSLQEITQKGLFNWNKQYGWEYEVDSESNNIWVLSQSVVLVVKILTVPNKGLQKMIESTKQLKNNKGTTFELKLTLQSQFGQILSQQLYKLQFKPLVIMNQLTFHNYQQAQEEFQLPLGQVEKNQFKLLSTDNLQFRWESLSSLNQTIQYLIIKYKFFKRVENSLRLSQKFQKIMDLVILDERSNFVIKTFRLNIFSYPKISNLDIYTIGQVKNYKFSLQFDQNSVTLPLTNSTNLLKSNRNMFRVSFHSSNPKHAQVKCQAKQQILCDKSKSKFISVDKVYEVQLRFQSFQNTEQERVVVHAVDIQNLTVMKRWMFKFQKKFQDYQHVFTLKTKHSKTLFYNYALRNSNNNQRSYKLYSSNNSILAVPDSLVQLNGSQNTQIKLQINVKRQLKQQQKQKGVHVIMRVQQENGRKWNQLFRIMVSE